MSRAVVGKRRRGIVHCGDGSELTLVLLEMRSGDRIASIRVTPSDGGGAVCARFGARGARLLLSHLQEIVVELEADAEHARAARQESQ